MSNGNIIQLLLLTDRPLITACFSQLEQLGNSTLQVSTLPMTIEAVGEYSQSSAKASFGAIDVAPDPIDALSICHALRRQTPGMPLLGVVCCIRQLHISHLEGLVAAGITSFIDLSLTPEALLHALLLVAHGHTVLQIDLPFRDNPGWFMNRLVESWPGGANTPMHTFFTEEENSNLLECIASGLSDKEIGKRLCLSPSTVHHRIERLCKITETRNRTELAAWAGTWGFYESTQPTRLRLGNTATNMGNIALIAGKAAGGRG